MPDDRIRLIAGLGNPGAKYRNTRHNAGFMAADKIAAAYAIDLDIRKFGAFFGTGVIEGIRVVLAKPQLYMNRSGLPVFRIAEHFKISSRDILVIHDDIDLAFGRLKIKQKGGTGGHNGIRSLTDAFDGGNFSRLRIGIGRDCGQSGDASVTDHVLGSFSEDETRCLDPILKNALEAVVTILSRGIMEGMNRFNKRKVSFHINYLDGGRDGSSLK
ncbi:MAG: aminoacyl-tRNA hydrolase [Desulfobacteraceae bacterium 4572_123]|nr:MAG: aminoacyl-tRNA hydrolase [Desulfobacteraceae bacterium 4572_123]